MWCFISEPHGLIHEFVLARDARGHECMEKVCNQLNLVEKDYFGLRYKCLNSGVEMWLNLRNKMSDQLTGKPPYRLQLLVKFHVKPQELQQQVTRDLFYLTLRKDLFNGKYDMSKVDHETCSKLLALIAYIDFGDFDAERGTNYETIIPSVSHWSNEFYQMVEREHFEFSNNITPQVAKIELLVIVASLDEYGVETFLVSAAHNHSDRLLLAVKYDGLRIYQVNNLKKKKSLLGKEKASKSMAIKAKESSLIQFIRYEDISTVSYKGKMFTIVDSDQYGTEHRLSFRLLLQQATINVFRTFTEFHSFYQCNVVKKSVQEKCTRTPVGKITSFFHPNVKSGKLYLFDVMRTRRQAYNYAWKELNDPGNRRQSVFFRSERKFKRRPTPVGKVSKDDSELSTKVYRTVHYPDSSRTQKAELDDLVDSADEEEEVENKIKLRTKSVLSNSNETPVETLSIDELKEVVRTLQDSRVCHVCMEGTVSTAFCPCGHVVCCLECSVQCKECPLCRTHVTYAQRVFFACDA